MFSRTFALFAAIITFTLTQTALAGQQAVIKDAWIADAPPVAKIRAGYLQLQNAGKDPITLQSLSSPAFARIELHKTVVEGGMAKMLEIKQLTLQAGETVEFKPGGYHLMMFTPKSKLQQGDKVQIQMQFDNKMTTSFTTTVRQRGGGMQDDHEHHHH